jgi:SAM-dependent methyltransferase
MSVTEQQQPPIANAEMAAAWASEGEDWARDWERYDRGVAAHHAVLLDAAGIEPGDHVVDIGCGNGQVTRDAARAAHGGDALGLDLSLAMLERARALAASEGCHNVTFELADAQVHPFEPAATDVVVSRFGAMFFADPVAAFTNLARATRPGGRLAVIAWRELGDNEWLGLIRGALAAGRDVPAPPVGAPGPFGLADASRTAGWLADAGFDEIAIDPFDAPIWMGSDAADAVTFVSGGGMARGLLSGLEDAERSRALDALREVFERHDGPNGVGLGSASWVISARRAG